jgi:hypothetical protein
VPLDRIIEMQPDQGSVMSEDTECGRALFLYTLAAALDYADRQGGRLQQLERQRQDRAPGCPMANGTRRRPFRMLIERDVAEIERRLELYRENAPKRIAADLNIQPNTITKINLMAPSCPGSPRREPA